MNEHMPPGRGDPWDVLGLTPKASEEEIRAAYLRKVKEFPPERAGEQFERVRDAYESLRDSRRRLHYLLFGVDPLAPLVSLFENYLSRRKFVGPKPWMEVWKGR